MRPELIRFQQEMEKKFGRNALRPADQLVSLSDIRISTGSISLDLALGGGLPVGRFVQFSGAFSCGKSTIAYHCIKNAQGLVKYVKQGKEEVTVPLDTALYQSEANSWTDEYGYQIGIDVPEMMLNESSGMEETFELITQAQRRGLLDFGVIDSLEALEPTKEYNNEFGDSLQMGIKQQLYGQFFRKFCAGNNRIMREDGLPCTILGINQLREKIGAYGDPEYEPGGRAIGFYSSLTVRFRRGDWITVGKGENKRIIGQVVKFKISKNKIGIPQRSGSFDFYFDEGGQAPPGHFDNIKEIILEGVAYGIINKAGSWFEYEGVKTQGTESLVEELREDCDLLEEIRDKLYEVASDPELERDSIEEEEEE